VPKPPRGARGRQPSGWFRARVDLVTHRLTAML
jgi:hypothetical protein